MKRFIAASYYSGFNLINDYNWNRTCALFKTKVNTPRVVLRN